MSFMISKPDIMKTDNTPDQTGDLFEDNNAENEKTTADDLKGSNTEKDPDEWVTGDEPMTGAQKSYLKTLSDEAKEEFDENLSKAEASKRIDELQHKTGRGL
jgi:hypothetical protein